MSDHFLNDSWSFYFHDPDDNDWSRKSFHRLTDVITIEDYWTLEHHVSSYLHQGMFFLMRESVFPLWEEKENRNGGYFSLKILKSKVVPAWEELCAYLLTEKLSKNQELMQHINGISISPKKSFCIVKIWIGSPALSNVASLDLRNQEFNEVLYKAYEQEAAT